MAWYSRLFTGQEGRKPGLTTSQQQSIDVWHELPAADLRRSHYRTRYVVVDVETTVIEGNADRLVSLGALAVVDGLIDFKDVFQACLANESADGEAASDGRPQIETARIAAVDALLAFLRFAGKAPLISFHASFAAQQVDRAMGECLGVALRQPWIDLAWVMSDLFRDVGDDIQGGLDGWLAHFDIESIKRHDVVSDAYATAKLLQITIARAARKGFDSPSSLLDLEKARRHLHQSG